MKRSMHGLVFVTLVSMLAAACGERRDAVGPEPLFPSFNAAAGSSADVPAGGAVAPTYVTGGGPAAAGHAPIIRVYQNSIPWFGENRANATILGLGKILGDDYFIHPVVDLQSGIPAGTAVVFLTSNGAGLASAVTDQNHPAAQAALSAFLAGGGRLIVDMGDNVFVGGYIAPGSVGTPDYVFPSPCADATLTAAAVGHPFTFGPDGAPGGGDDLTSANIDMDFSCFVAHGNLEEGIALPISATPLATATFGGVQRTTVAEYCHGPGRVILDTHTKEFVGQNPGGTGPGTFLNALVSYALSPASRCIIPVDIDIKPGSFPNSINCKQPDGVIPVAILTTASFDATTVNHETVRFEGAREWHRNRDGTARRHVEDVDADGDLDLVFHFRRGDTALTCSSTTGKLTGNIFAGTPIEGNDSVRMVPN